MLLRSGKIKEQIAKCYKCNEFYGNKKYKYKCSGCYRGLKNQYPWRDEDFRNRVNAVSYTHLTLPTILRV